MLTREVFVQHEVGSSEARRLHARRMVLCRMFVIAAFLPAVMLASRAWSDTSIEDDARRQVRSYALEAFPQWAQTQHERLCPDSIEALAPFVETPTIDAWGTPLAMHCGPLGIVVRSAGPDRRLVTSDDITSQDD